MIACSSAWRRGVRSPPRARRRRARRRPAPELSMSRGRVDTRIGTDFRFRHHDLEPRRRAPGAALIAHLDVVSRDPGVYVDPEDWSSERTRYLPPVGGGASIVAPVDREGRQRRALRGLRRGRRPQRLRHRDSEQPATDDGRAEATAQLRRRRPARARNPGRARPRLRRSPAAAPSHLALIAKRRRLVAMRVLVVEDELKMAEPASGAASSRRGTRPTSPRPARTRCGWRRRTRTTRSCST